MQVTCIQAATGQHWWDPGISRALYHFWLNTGHLALRLNIVIWPISLALLYTAVVQTLATYCVPSQGWTLPVMQGGQGGPGGETCFKLDVINLEKFEQNCQTSNCWISHFCMDYQRSNLVSHPIYIPGWFFPINLFRNRISAQWENRGKLQQHFPLSPQIHNCIFLYDFHQLPNISNST